MTVIGLAIGMAGLFVASYSLALGRPTPHRIPAGVVGDEGQRPGLIVALGTATHGGLQLRPLASTAAAEREINAQHIYAALVLSTPRPELLVASAAGTSVARLLEQAANTAAQSSYGAPARLSISAPRSAPICTASTTERPLARPNVNPATNESPQP